MGKASDKKVIREARDLLVVAKGNLLKSERERNPVHKTTCGRRRACIDLFMAIGYLVIPFLCLSCANGRVEGYSISTSQVQSKQAYIDPKKISELVKTGKYTFAHKDRVTLVLDENNSFTIEPTLADETTQGYQMEALQLPPGGYHPPPPSPRPGPPLPLPGPGRNGSKPGKPPPPGKPGKMPPVSPPVPPKKTSEKSLLQEYAEVETVVGRLTTEGIKQENWSLPKGIYTIALTMLNGKPVATLIDANGNFVLTLDRVALPE